MSIVQNTQFTGTDQEAEASEQQYHLCLTSESRLRATVSKASAWITGPCSRSRHTFSSFSRTTMASSRRVCVYRARGYARVSHGSDSAFTQGRHSSPRLRLILFLFFSFSFFVHSRRVYYYSLGKVQCTSSTRCQEEAFPSRRVHQRKEMDVPATFSGVALNAGMEFGRTPRGPKSRRFRSSRITVVLRFLSGI